MKGTILRIVVIALLAIAALIPQSVVLARPEDSDNGCPPRATQGDDHASQTGTDRTDPVNPPAPAQAWSATNPGNK